MDNKFYTYAYLREDGTPYYIGKGKGRRAFRKEGRAIKTPPRERILLLKTGLTEEEAFRHEIYMIALYGRKDKGTGILYNFTDGGEGTSGWVPSTSTIDNIRRGLKGKNTQPKSQEHKQKLSSSLKGRLIGNHGREVTVYFPWGKIGVFSSIGSASLYLGVSYHTLSQWLNKGVKPSGVYWGYRVR
jgi:hypothetical protein